MSRRPTVKDVAEAAGVSVATVSRALSGARVVRPELQELVVRTADALGYRPHLIAQALRRSRSGAIGMIVPKIENPFFPQLVGHADRVLQQHNLALLLCSADDDPELEAKRISILAERQIDGLLISPCSQSASAPALAEIAARMPVVQFDQRVPTVATPFVGIDDAAGIAAVTAHLGRSGRRRLAFIGADTDNWSGQRRTDGFEAWADAEDPSARQRILAGDFSREFGHDAAMQLLAADGQIDAIVCANDLLALGALDAATELGIGVPDQLAITGFDDINIATVSRPTLTTVRQPVAEMVEKAIGILLNAIDGAVEEPVDIRLPVELIIRGSAPRGAQPN
ncbi:LacI family DNA-binding transcriptional regulator [Salinibacterium sp. NK8237]|uniref:LacI family DNA-binding transcriptional regulator n=1 Tax=Salinibacterium sp. NK8237 TaxID=2792038 RepID=UPI0018CE5546|nr:LacI family DNA-binding transcriptional regulator [Salinibacterium sp. NK8237]MBH0130697.1 LacI family DNA-binding transcriptional regulator [Salinibacterium sp. NK8237]